mmetsp:Transcript_2957/g.4455  ORF Transcript_2957/g.4455 Transcript_2957/m.4455 type:complete len:226 (-) Transcript_2957:20-697(-)
MGTTISSPKMGILALSKKMSLTQIQLIDLMRECIVVTCGVKRENFTIDENSFQSALKDCMFKSSDADILNDLFTMWDEEGFGFVSYRTFLAGLSPLACGDCYTIGSALSFSMKLIDPGKTGCITPVRVYELLVAINKTAGFLGDPVLKAVEIQDIVKHVFLRQSHTRTHKDVLPRLERHPSIAKFVNGRGTQRYRPTGEDKHKGEERRGGIPRNRKSIGHRLYEA